MKECTINMGMFHLIKQHVSILDIVQEYTTLKKAGSYWKGSCPFHHEKTASFTVSPHKEIFYCFGCHAGGDVITFIQKAEQRDPLQAAQYLAQRYNIELPQSTYNAQESASRTEHEDLYNELCKRTAEWCYNNLLKNPSLLNYLNKRGFTRATIDTFQIGHFPGGFVAIKGFTEYMRTHNILVNDLVESNILAQGRTTLYSPFESRVIFPIKDHLGRFCGFGGRIFMPNDERPKYYNSRENDYFVKGNLLFGFDLAKKTVQKTGIIFIVEGYTDCLAMVQHNFPNTVATLGTACTGAHLKTISRYAQQVYILYDNDSAGNNAILRLTELCWQVDLELKVVCLPVGQDPASFLVNNNDLQPYIDEAQDVFIFFIKSLGSNFDNKLMPEKLLLTRKLIAIIKTLDDPLKQDFLLQKASKVFGVPFQTLKHELLRTESKKSTPEYISPKEDCARDEQVPALEKKIFYAIMKDIQTLNNYNKKYLIGYMPGMLKNILVMLHEKQCSDPTIVFQSFFSSLDEKQQKYIGKILLEYDYAIDQKEFEQLLLRLQKKHWKTIVHDIKKQLTKAKQEGNTSKVEEIVGNFLELKQKMAPHMPHKQIKTN